MTHTIEIPRRVPSQPRLVVNACTTAAPGNAVTLIVAEGGFALTSPMSTERADALAAALTQAAREYRSALGPPRRAARNPHGANFTAEQNWGEGEV